MQQRNLGYLVVARKLLPTFSSHSHPLWRTIFWCHRVPLAAWRPPLPLLGIGCWGSRKASNWEVEREAERLFSGKRVRLRCLACNRSIPKAFRAFLSKGTWHLKTLGEIFTSSAGSSSRTAWLLRASRRNFYLGG